MPEICFWLAWNISGFDWQIVPQKITARLEWWFFSTMPSIFSGFVWVEVSRRENCDTFRTKSRQFGWFVDMIDHTPVVDRSSRYFLKPFCRIFSPNFARDEPNLDYVLGTMLWRNQHPPQRFSCFMTFFQYSTLCIKLKSVDDWLFVDLLN